MTNGEWIRNMSNEELAEFLLEVKLKDVSNICGLDYCVEKHKGCKGCFKEWLEKERD